MLLVALAPVGAEPVASRVVPSPPVYEGADFVWTVHPDDHPDASHPPQVVSTPPPLARLAPPRPKATPAHPERSSNITTRPKLAGGPYKPWRLFNANVMRARVYAQSVLSRTSWRCLDVLFDRESRWRTHAGNRHSGAYGIPQALPGSKMAWAGADWRDNATTQVRWGIHYIKGRYGNACIALDHSYRWGWY
jgi:hypothetical protein